MSSEHVAEQWFDPFSLTVDLQIFRLINTLWKGVTEREESCSVNYFLSVNIININISAASH